MSSVKSSSAREPPTRLRILYYRSVHGPARRGGSAWWSVGLIGFCRSLTAALLGHPKVRGSNPRPDTSPRAFVAKIHPVVVHRSRVEGSMVEGPGTPGPAGATLFGLSGPRLRQVGIA